MHAGRNVANNVCARRDRIRRADVTRQHPLDMIEGAERLGASSKVRHLQPNEIVHVVPISGAVCRVRLNIAGINGRLAFERLEAG